MPLHRPIGLLAGLACGLLPGLLPAVPGGAQPAIAQSGNPTLPITVGHGTVVGSPDPITKVAVTNPNVADVAVISAKEVLVNGKKPGATTLMVWTRGHRRTYDVVVKVDAELLRRTLAQALGPQKFECAQTGDTVILTGRVAHTSQIAMAGKIAQGFAPHVVNLLESDNVQQVQVDVEVVELTKTSGAEHGTKWGSLVVDPTGKVNFVPDFMTFAQGTVGQFSTFGQVDRLSAQIEVLIKEGKAKMLARPTLMAISGGSASVLVGGEVPIPEAQQFGNVTISWRDFGVKLDVQPTVHEDGRIALTVKPEVSSLDFTNGVRVNNFLIPALTTRRAATEVLLASGQGIAIGGLMQSSEANNVEKLPLLGDIPVIGELFKSTKFQKNETELTILVTPHVVGAAQAQATPPSGGPSKGGA